jgi:hypothetical protein
LFCIFLRSPEHRNRSTTEVNNAVFGKTHSLRQYYEC